MFCGCGACETEEERRDDAAVDDVEEALPPSRLCGWPFGLRRSADGGKGVASLRLAGNPHEREGKCERCGDGEDAGVAVQARSTLEAPAPASDLSLDTALNPDLTPHEEEIVCIAGVCRPDEDPPQADPPQEDPPRGAAPCPGDAAEGGRRGRREGDTEARRSKQPQLPATTGAAQTPSAAPRSSRSGATHSARSGGGTTARSSGSESTRRSRTSDAVPPNVHLRPAVSFAVQLAVGEDAADAPEVEAFRSPEGGALKITRIGAAFENWNAANKYREVRVGDFIVEVNRERGTPDELRIRMSQPSAAPVDLLVKRLVGHGAPTQGEKPVAKTLLQRLSSYGGSSARGVRGKEKGTEKASVDAPPQASKTPPPQSSKR